MFTKTDIERFADRVPASNPADVSLFKLPTKYREHSKHIVGQLQRKLIQQFRIFIEKHTIPLN